MKNVIFAILSVFLTWAVMDFVIHSILLADAYREYAILWRPAAEMKLGLIYLTTLLAATGFVAVYAFLINPKGMKPGIIYGLITGVFGGIVAGFGSYAVMPISMTLALGWMAEYTSQCVVAGLITASLVSESEAV